MKNLILALSVVLLVPAFAHAKCDVVTVGWAKGMASKAQESFDRGVATKWAVLMAQATSLDAQECGGEISQALYCAKKSALLSELIGITNDRVTAGAGSQADLSYVMGQSIDLGRRCQ